MSRGLHRSEEWLAERELRLKAESKQKDVHLAGDKPKQPPSPELLAEIAAIQAIVAKPKRIAPVDRTVNAPKYRNQKVEIGGIKFDSRKEAKRWQELKLLEAAGSIRHLSRQVTYRLLPAQKRADGTKERAVGYIADFEYSEAGKAIVEDVKGMKTPIYILKRKLMLWVHGISIKEI